MTEQAQMEATQNQATRAGGDQIGRFAGEAPASSEALIADELLVEEISIDGMCGVY